MNGARGRKFVFASDSFKGSLSSEKINEILTACAKKYFPQAQTLPFLIADGGEGTLEAVISQTGGRYVSVGVTDPAYGKTTARYGVFGDAAIVCMSEASGLPLLAEDKRRARFTTSYGTGELIRHAVESGYKKLYVTLGGSATNDGGVGALQALGYAFYDRDGKPCRGVGDELWKIASIDGSKAIGLAGVETVLLCDVSNPLLGPRGATYTYGKQKGADENDLAHLEKGMQNYAAVVEKYIGKSADIAGGGAAGGLGAALYAFMGAKIRSGIHTVLDLCGFDEAVKGADLIVTGEGRVDFQSANGKVLDGILSRASGVPVVAIAGSEGDGAEALYEKGLTAVFSIVNAPMALQNALDNAESLYQKAAENVFRLLKTYME